ncbi:MAG: LruC domain-containing protein, partial [bacterium]
FDFNDVVISYYAIETKQNDKVTRIMYTAKPEAVGAALSNAFRLKLNVPISNIKKITKAYDGNVYNLTATADGSSSIIEIFSNVKSAITPPTGYNMSNTIQGSPPVLGKQAVITIDFHAGVASSQLGSAPYDSYIDRGDGLGNLVEIDLPGIQPTNQVALFYFGTADDKTNIGSHS